MNNFTYYNPVRIVFGKDTISEIKNLIPSNKKILFVYGGGSIKKNGVYDQVIDALKGYSYVEFSGIEPNPTYETCMKAVDVVKQNNVDFILAVGGGSVIDGAKFISAASQFKGEDPWDILSKGAEVESTLPQGNILTLPATGTEMNRGAVISRKETQEKLPFFTEKIFPNFSIIDPETNYSLPKKQVINGIVDAYIHVIEQYVTFPVYAPLQNRQAEAILQSIIELAPIILNEPRNYEARANFCWCTTHALNGLIACGMPQCWGTHAIGHELTALYGLDHAESLAVVLTNLWKVQKDKKFEKITRYAREVFGIKEDDRNEIFDKAIDRTISFFESVGMSTKLSDYNINSEEAAEKISQRFKDRGATPGMCHPLSPEDIKEILLNC